MKEGGRRGHGLKHNESKRLKRNETEGEGLSVNLSAFLGSFHNYKIFIFYNNYNTVWRRA